MYDEYLGYYCRSKDNPKYLKSIVDVIKLEYLKVYSNRSYKQNEQSIKSVMYSIIKNWKLGYCGMLMPRDKNFYSKPNIINGSNILCKISYQGIINTLNILEDSGYIESHKGFNIKDELDKKQSGFILFTRELLEILDNLFDKTKLKFKTRENVVILKDTKGEDVLYRKTKEVRTMIDNLDSYNAFMSKQLVFCEDCQINTDLHRTFSRGSFELGGRFYSEGYGVQQLSKKDRKNITINNEDTIEFDLKNLHPALLYAKKQIALDEGFDVYGGTDLISCLDYDIDVPYILERNKTEKYEPIRNLLKLCMLVLINAKNRQSAISAIKQEVFKDTQKPRDSRKFWGIGEADLDEYINLLKEHNSQIQDYFFSDEGVKLQNKDSKIIEYVMVEAVKLEIPVLFVHDSVICPSSKAGIVLKLMKDGYESVVGSLLNCRIELC